jgi:GntR family transcriptional regulator
VTVAASAETLAGFILRALAEADGARPLYLRLREALSEALRLGVADTQAGLPSERWLAERLGVSRVTLRRALDELAADGLLSRRQGARTTVARRVEKMLSTLTGFSDELRARGIEPGQRWISRRTLAPSPAEAMALGLSGSDSIVRLVRVRLADGQPIAIERAAVPQAILPSGDLVSHSLYDALARLGSPPVRGVQRIRAGLMTRVDAELLESDLGAPLLIVERRCFLADGQPVEFTETRYNGESYDFLTELGA